MRQPGRLNPGPETFEYRRISAVVSLKFRRLFSRPVRSFIMQFKRARRGHHFSTLQAVIYLNLSKRPGTDYERTVCVPFRQTRR